MKAIINGGRRRPFVPFNITLEVTDTDELYALTLAAGRMCNGHGNEFYDLLAEKCREFDVEINP